MAIDYGLLPIYEYDESCDYQCELFRDEMDNSNFMDALVNHSLGFDNLDLTNFVACEADLSSGAEPQTSFCLDLDSKEPLYLTHDLPQPLATNSTTLNKTTDSRSRGFPTQRVSVIAINILLLLILGLFYHAVQPFNFPNLQFGLGSGFGLGVADSRGENCVLVGFASGSGYLAAPGCFESTDKPIAETVLSELQISIQDRLAEHQAHMGTEMAAVAQNLAAITSTLGPASEELSLIRSLIGMNEFGKEKCGVECAARVAVYLQTHDLALGKGSDEFRDLVGHLQAMDAEMAAYSSFLASVAEKYARVVGELEASAVNTTVAAQYPRLNGPLAVLYAGEFNTTESLVRNKEEELQEAIIKAFATSTPLEPELFALLLQNNLAALSSLAYEDDKMYLCSYAVKVSNLGLDLPDGVELMSLECGIEV